MSKNTTFFVSKLNTTLNINITFDANGGTLSGAANFTGKFGETLSSAGITLPTKSSISRDDYFFVGWTSELNNSSAAVYPSSVITKDLNRLYAYWVPTTINVVFNTSGGKMDEPSAYLLRNGSTFLLNEDVISYLPIPSLEGYRFYFWTDPYDETTSSFHIYSYEDDFIASLSPTIDTINLYPLYQPKISFNWDAESNGGQIVTDDYDWWYYDDEYYWLPTAIGPIGASNLEGWFTTPSGDDGKQITIYDTIEENAPTTYYARFTKGEPIMEVVCPTQNLSFATESDKYFWTLSDSSITDGTGSINVDFEKLKNVDETQLYNYYSSDHDWTYGYRCTYFRTYVEGEGIFSFTVNLKYNDEFYDSINVIGDDVVMTQDRDKVDCKSIYYITLGNDFVTVFPSSFPCTTLTKQDFETKEELQMKLQEDKRFFANNYSIKIDTNCGYFTHVEVPESLTSVSYTGTMEFTTDGIHQICFIYNAGDSSKTDDDSSYWLSSMTFSSASASISNIQWIQIEEPEEPGPVVPEPVVPEPGPILNK